MRSAAAAALAFVWMLLAPGFAQDAKLEDFAGQWIGKVSVETSGPTDFPNSVREVGFTLRPGPKGFTLEWSTVRYETGSPDRPVETAQDTEVSFKQGPSAQRWEASGGNPSAGKPYWYARLEGNTLTVVGFALLENGKAELQTYQRTLEGDSMGLSYTRVVDGAVLRRASGALTRFAE